MRITGNHLASSSFEMLCMSLIECETPQSAYSNIYFSLNHTTSFLVWAFPVFHTISSRYLRLKLNSKFHLINFTSPFFVNYIYRRAFRLTCTVGSLVDRQSQNIVNAGYPYNGCQLVENYHDACPLSSLELYVMAHTLFWSLLDNLSVTSLKVHLLNLSMLHRKKKIWFEKLVII